MLISIIRHAETVANRERLIQGHLPGTLTDFGRKQAKKLGKRLAGERIDVIYSSDLKRARQTTKKIAKRHPHVPVVLDSRLRERGAGVFEGLPLGACARAAKEAGISEREFRPEGGESWDDVSARARDFWLDLISKFSGMIIGEQDPSRVPHIVLVSHKGFISELLHVIFDFCGLEESFGESLSLPTSIFHASLTTLFFQPHLPQQPQPQPQPPAAQQSFLQSVPVKLHLHRLRALRMNDVAHLRDLRLKAKAEEGKKAAHSNKKNINKTSYPFIHQMPKRESNKFREITPPLSHSVPLLSINSSPLPLPLPLPSMPPVALPVQVPTFEAISQMPPVPTTSPRSISASAPSPRENAEQQDLPSSPLSTSPACEIPPAPTPVRRALTALSPSDGALDTDTPLL